MAILCESKDILACAGLGKTNIIRIGEKTISRALVRSATLTTLVVSVIFESLICIRNYELGISAILLPLGISFTYISLIFVYCTFLWKTSEIHQMLCYLQYAVNKSMPVVFDKFPLILAKSRVFHIFHIFTGMQLSRECYTIYQTQNDTTENYLRMAYSYSQILLCLSHVVPVLCPVLYLFIGFPTPDLWFTPLGIHEA